MESNFGTNTLSCSKIQRGWWSTLPLSGETGLCPHVTYFLHTWSNIPQMKVLLECVFFLLVKFAFRKSYPYALLPLFLLFDRILK